MEQETLDQVRPDLTKRASESENRLQGTLPIHAKAQRIQARRPKCIGHFSFGSEANHRGVPASAVETRRQRNEHPLSAADIEVGDHQCDGDWLERPATRPLTRWAFRQGPARIEYNAGKLRSSHFAFEAMQRDSPLQTSLFDFELPDELIAQEPVEPRDRSRLLVVYRRENRWEHHPFAALPELLATGDILVRNNTRVVPARLVGHRVGTGGKWEGLFLRALADGHWELLATTRGRPRPGEQVVVGRGLKLTLISKDEGGRWTVRPESDESPTRLLEQHGSVPLPPYIRKGQEGPADRLRYQTLYAQVPGAVAAPTAGLHFTADVFDRLKERSIDIVDLTLHVGLGTFRPIEADRIEEHTLHAEWAELSELAATRLNKVRRGRTGRIVAVGTTSARVLETAAQADSRFAPFSGETALYLRPGHVFRGVDALLTNFHLPRSSLLVLVSALAGVDLIKAVYAEAIAQRYRFYSYGDAMLIL